MDFKVFNDPLKIGPGLWFKIHIDALNAKDLISKKNFINSMNILCDNFKCQHCKEHFREELNNTNFNNYNEEYGYFKWSWEFHNKVNLRLKKPQISYNDAYNYFKNDDNICIDCGNKDKKILKIISRKLEY